MPLRTEQAQHTKSEPTVAALRLISLNLGLMAVTYAAFYLGPERWVRIPRNKLDMEKQVSIVQHVEQIGPIWPFLFMMAGSLVIGCTLLGRGVIISHGIAAGVWVTFGLAVVLGAVLSVPPSPVLSGMAAIFGAVTHVGMARAWAGEGVK